VHGLVDVLACAQTGDDDGHFVLGTQRHVVLQPVVALVHDLVDGKRRGGLIWVRAVVRIERLGDFGQPLVELRGRARVERGHGAHDAGLALLDDELGIADDEQRRADDGKRHALQNSGQTGHESSFSTHRAPCR
jgi:hypothetical protein